MKDEVAIMEDQPAPRPAKRRRWWPWAVVIALLAGGGWVYWYDHSPAEYRVVGEYTTVGYPAASLRRAEGVVLQEAVGTFVFRDFAGRERWRLTRSFTSPSPSSPEIIRYLDRMAVSLSGHVYATAVREGSAWAIQTWRDGVSLGVAHVETKIARATRTREGEPGSYQVTVPAGGWGERLYCADEGTVFFTVYADFEHSRNYLLHGTTVVAQGTGAHEEMSIRTITLAPDGRTLIKRGADWDLILYGDLTITGGVLAVQWAAPVRYDGCYGTLSNEQPMDYHADYRGWQSYRRDYVGRQVAFIDYSTMARFPSKSIRPAHTSDRVAWVGSERSGWGLIVPGKPTSALATDDDQHLLVGDRRAADPWLPFRGWSLVNRLFPVPHGSATLCLYNRAGRKEARLPDDRRPVAAGGTKGVRSLALFASSPDGARLVLAIGQQLVFCRAAVHPTVWETLSGWCRRADVQQQ